MTLSDGITLYAQWEIPTTPITPTTINWKSGTYTLTQDTVISERVTVTGAVTLILPDDLTLTCKQGITLETGNALIIRCGEKGSGKLIVDGDVPDDCAGIGGGYKGNNGMVIIHGGDVTARSKEYDTFTYYGGAAIGGGITGLYEGGGGGGTVIISGGKVTATASLLGSAIGCGNGYTGKGGYVSILGGEVNATGCYAILEYEEMWSEGINGYLFISPGIKLEAKVYESDPWTDYNGEIPRQQFIRTKR